MGAKLERYARLSVADGLALIQGWRKPDERPEVLGVPCHTSGLRLYTFKAKGTVCVTCKLEGSFFAIERGPDRHCPNRDCFSLEDEPFHLNLYGIREDGSEVLMTHDHVLARSLGGLDRLSNTQTMCEYCNSRKGTVEGKVRATKAALNNWKSGNRDKPQGLSVKEHEALIQLFELTETKFPPISREKEAENRARNLERQRLTNARAEAALLEQIANGRTLTGNLGTFAIAIERGRYSEQGRAIIQQHLVEKRGFIPGVVFRGK